MTLKVVIAGEDQMPSNPLDREEAIRLSRSNAGLMNRIFSVYFSLGPFDRYMGNFPYRDKESGNPRVGVVVSMYSPYMRDAIVASLRAAINDAGLEDISVLKEDDNPTKRPRLEWPHAMEIVAMGPSVTDTLAGERKIEAALNALAAWLSRE